MYRRGFARLVGEKPVLAWSQNLAYLRREAMENRLEETGMFRPPGTSYCRASVTEKGVTS